MRALFINENIGGHATVHLHLESALADRQDIEAEFVHVPRPGLGRRLVGARLPILGPLDLDLQPLRAQLALSAVARRQLRHRLSRVDVVHLYTHNAGLLSVDLLRRRPTVVTLDTTNARNAYRLPYRFPTRWTPRTLLLTQAFERRVYDAATLVVATSEWAAASLREEYGLSDEKIRVLPFGIQVPTFDDRPSITTNLLPRVTFVGRQMARKGGWRLLDIHQRLLRDRCELVLVTMEPVPPAPNVTVVNNVRPGDPRLWSLLRSSSVFAFPSEIDQGPNVILEAMAAALPVVALRVAAVPEMVLSGRTGSLIDAGDDNGLAAAIIWLLDNPKEACQMGMAGRARVLERYNVELTANRLVELLQEADAMYGNES
jgi:alpha-maltose-1-phosphate synthase